jgi:GNAT superfamily N-acetyltransferase
MLRSREVKAVRLSIPRSPRAGITVPKLRAPVTISPLAEVLHLRDDIIRHYLQEWPNVENRLNPEIWGHLGDTAIPPRAEGIPLTLVAVTEAGEYVGQGSIIARDLGHRRYRDLGPWAGGLCVLPDFRGKGIGACLHYERLRIAADMGIEEMFLYTEKRPYKTVDLYHHFGWTVECEIPDWNDGSTIERRWVMTVNPQEIFPPTKPGFPR